MYARKFKSAAFAAVAGMLFQFGIGGCLDLEHFARQASIGFARGIGELPVSVVNDWFISDLLNLIAPTNEAG